MSGMPMGTDSTASRHSLTSEQVLITDSEAAFFHPLFEALGWTYSERTAGRLSGAQAAHRWFTGGLEPPRPVLPDRAHVRGLGALFALGDLELDSLTLAQGTLARPLDGGGMDEDVLSVQSGWQHLPKNREAKVRFLPGAREHVVFPGDDRRSMTLVAPSVRVFDGIV